MIKFCILFWVTVLAVTENNNFETSLVQLIQDTGHTVKVYKIHTEDNYILTVFRLPSKLKNPKVVFIMHGIESSAADYVIGGNNASLAYLLSDNGYDVWLGNARGNIFSRAHKTLSVDSHDFWKFSFHEIGMYDLPAIIDYALDKGDTTSLTYCGYSQGTTVFFVLLSMRPEYNSKISTAFLKAPVAYMRFPLPLVMPLVSMLDQLVGSLRAWRQYDFILPNQNMRKSAANYCNKRVAGLTTCKANYMLIGGDTNGQYNEDLIPKIFQYFPASAGYGQMLHYGQIIRNNGSFIRFDHEKRRNLELYGQPVPPQYNLANLRTNMHFLYGVTDAIANLKDVEFLITKLKAHITGITKIRDWNHLDFIYGKDVQKKVNNVILQKMKST
ncbi:lipase 3-like [Bradysia coprophila]|uniref:lipase 3-like n=1 Tax=Bradysia coprophila TaxID=38358 RepID=UPI00187DA24E|nr:lipase 3-like [Bradysia coprophila]